MNAEEIYRPLGVSPQVCLRRAGAGRSAGALCGRRPRIAEGQSGQGACRDAEKSRQRGLLAARRAMATTTWAATS